MERILCNRYGDLLVRQAEQPELAAGQVLLRVECAIAVPYEPFPVLRNRVPGRYFFARVEDTADDVMNVFPDDAVTVMSVIPCGQCESCAQGRPQDCQHPLHLGEDMDGAWQEEMVVPAAFVHPLDEDTDPLIGAMFAPLAIVTEALLRNPVAYGKLLGIAGCDFFGCLALQAGKAMGFSPICGLDESEAYRRRAVRFGADFTLNPANDHAAARLMNLTQEGLDLIVTTGETAPCPELVKSGLKPDGKAVTLRSQPQDGETDPDSRFSIWEYCTKPVSRDALRTAFWIMKQGLAQMEELVDRRISLEALPGAWDDAKAGLVRGIIVIDPQMKLE